MKILDFIICDDVREEVNAKMTLVGTYVDKLVYGYTKKNPIKWPVHARTYFYVKFCLCEQGEADIITFRFKDGGKNTVHYEQSINLLQEHVSKLDPGLFIVRYPKIDLFENSTIELELEYFLKGESKGIVQSGSIYQVESREAQSS